MRNLLLSAIILLSGASSFAQESPVKDTVLRSLINQAVTNYPRIKELEEQLKTLKKKLPATDGAKSSESAYLSEMYLMNSMNRT